MEMRAKTKPYIVSFIYFFLYFFFLVNHKTGVEKRKTNSFTPWRWVYETVSWVGITINTVVCSPLSMNAFEIEWSVTTQPFCRRTFKHSSWAQCFECACVCLCETHCTRKMTVDIKLLLNAKLERTWKTTIEMKGTEKTWTKNEEKHTK